MRKEGLWRRRVRYHGEAIRHRAAQTRRSPPPFSTRAPEVISAAASRFDTGDPGGVRECAAFQGNRGGGDRTDCTERPAVLASSSTPSPFARLPGKRVSSVPSIAPSIIYHRAPGQVSISQGLEYQGLSRPINCSPASLIRCSAFPTQTQPNCLVCFLYSLVLSKIPILMTNTFFTNESLFPTCLARARRVNSAHAHHRPGDPAGNASLHPCVPIRAGAPGFRERF